ncbi:hypothetical protein THIARS_70687 [Thiomonas delicata]|uniref:Uncharacterized protein n=1 Tax=Thiomonas delicata TaxID=364030 RepID=A0A238D6Y3_THIDL|nr:hypothetical protein THIARS_70687 [Thiomonas delicata]
MVARQIDQQQILGRRGQLRPFPRDAGWKPGQPREKLAKPEAQSDPRREDRAECAAFAPGRHDKQHEEPADRKACRVAQFVVAERQSKARAQDGGRDPLRQRSDYRKTVAFCLPAGCVGLWSDFWIRHVSSPRKSVTVASNPDRSFLGLPQDQQLTWHRSVWAPNFWLHQTP